MASSDSLFDLVQGSTIALVQEISETGIEISPDCVDDFCDYLCRSVLASIQLFLVGTRSGLSFPR